MVKRQIIKKIILLCVLLNFIKAQCPEQCECAGGDDICTSCISEDKWGPQCLDDCGERCSGGCDFTSGICSQCKAGFWQEDCSSSCGNCQEQSEGVSICNRESGACSSQGCISGYYGTQCDQDCPTTCNPASCDRDSGNCEACQSGKYGSKCNEDCGNCKNKDGDTSICNFSDGKCNDEGCVDGYYGDYCKSSCQYTCKTSACDRTTGECEACPSGKYGSTCNDNCGNCKNKDGDTSICNFSDGKCDDEGCLDGYHGDYCKDNCPSTCKTPACDRSTGDCLACPPGKYGNLCDEDCGNCKTKEGETSICDFNDGKCDDEGCLDGYHGDYCKDNCPSTCKTPACDRSTGDCLACPPGKYGNLCDEDCGNCKTKEGETSICDFNDGKCDAEGCLDGYHGDLCKEECPTTCSTSACDRTTGDCLACPNGKYYKDCSKDCGFCKNQVDGTSICNFEDGKCDSQGCLPGYYGELCLDKCADNCKDGLCDASGCSECIPGKWNTNCTDNCGYCANLDETTNTSICLKDTGLCDSQGCLPGYYGEKCLDKCADNCKDGLCDASGCLECIPGKWDSNCTNSCGNCAHLDESTNTPICSKDTGKCDDQGCQPGFYGEMCLDKCADNCKDGLCNEDGCIECIPGKWDSNCENSCGHCAHLDENTNTSICIKETGLCDEQGCLPGYSGEACNNGCPTDCLDGLCDISTGECFSCNPGKYSKDCTLDCGHCLNKQGDISICDFESGLCDNNGCEPGFFLQNCTGICPLNCEENICDINSGLCNACIPGKWFEDCTKDCGHCANKDLNSNSSICDIETGNCDEKGCEAGFYGADCNLECPKDCVDGRCDNEGKCLNCPPGTWGNSCESTCDINCNLTTANCDITTGFCLNCNSGFYTSDIDQKECLQCKENCLKECSASEGCFECKEPHQFGQWCEEECPNCKEGEDGKFCYRNGTCLGECIQTFYSEFCNDTCPEHCAYEGNNSCSQDLGECEECEIGFFPKKCDKCPIACISCNSLDHCFECVELDKFGEVCTETCNPNCYREENQTIHICNKDTGRCNSCIPGFYTPTCNEPCPNGCTVCNQDSGECGSCEPNFYLEEGICKPCGIECNQCSNGTYCTECNNLTHYGPLCEEICPEHCLYTPATRLLSYNNLKDEIRKCDRITGNCFGCEENFIGDQCENCVDSKYGELCDLNCEEGCDISKGNCDRLNSSCICKDGYFGYNCSEICQDGCIRCDQATGDCIDCEIDYYNDEGFCEHCSENCTEGMGCSKTKCNSCIDGKYGDLCESFCSPHCSNVTCEQDTGVCDGGCAPNFNGSLCLECNFKRYGGKNIYI